MENVLEIGDAKVAVSLLTGNRNVFNDVSGAEIHPNGRAKLVDEDGLTQYYPRERVGSIEAHR